MSLIEVRHLRKEYPDATPLTDVNATVEKGETISIIGPSGTGKSTFLRCLNRLETPTSGRIVVDGVDVLAPNADLPALRRKMGMVFQSFNLFPHLFVAENVMFGPERLLGMSKQEAYDRAIKLLAEVGLKEKALSYPHELSGGQRQRVAIARALAMEPEILLFDEPTSALDPTMVSEVLSVIRDLGQRGLTMLIVTHELRFARDVSDRVFYMDRGQVWEQGTPEEIFDNPQRRETHDFVFRVHNWEWELHSVDYDYPGMEASLVGFCARRFLGRRATNACQLVVEELIAGRIIPAARRAGITNPNIRMRLAVAEDGGEATLQVDCRDLLDRGVPRELLQVSGDELSDSLLSHFATPIPTRRQGIMLFQIEVER